MVEYYGEVANLSGGERFRAVWDGLDASVRAIARWAKYTKERRNCSGMARALEAESFRNVPEHVLDQALEAAQAWLRAPVPYFEAKPQRAVPLDEFPGAAISSDTPADVRELLERHGLVVREYGTQYDETAREETVKALRQDLADSGHDVLFVRLGDTIPVTTVEPLQASLDDLYRTANETFREQLQGTTVTTRDGVRVHLSKQAREEILSTGRRD